MITADNLLKQATGAVRTESEQATGWLISLDKDGTAHIITAGHVLGRDKPVEELVIQFPDDVERRADKVAWRYEPAIGLDFAVLRVSGFVVPTSVGMIPTEVGTTNSDITNPRQPLPVSITAEVTSGSQFHLRGYGEMLEAQSPASGEFKGRYDVDNRAENQLFQLRSHEAAVQGFSGGAIFSDELQAVVAIQIQTTADYSGVGSETVLALPLYRIMPYWPQLMQQAMLSEPISRARREWLAQQRAGQTATVTVPMQLPERPQHFTDRKAEMKQLLDDLKPGQTTALCGPGGMGKTAIATEALWQLTNGGQQPPAMFPHGVLWHSFYSQRLVDQALENIARAFGLDPNQYKSPLAAAQHALSGKQAVILLDGAEDADNLPVIHQITGNCGVIVTSRKPKDAPNHQQRQQLQPLPIDEAVKLLQKWLGILDFGLPIADLGLDNPQSKIENLKSICELIGGLPLAVRLVGRYLVETGDTPASYLAWLEEQPFEALDPDEAQHRHESVPWLLARSLEQVDETARQFLTIASQLALAPFEPTIIATCLELSTGQLKRALRQLTGYGLLYVADSRADAPRPHAPLDAPRPGESVAGGRGASGMRPYAERRDEVGPRYEISHALIYSYAATLDLQGATHLEGLAPLSRLVDYYTHFVQTHKDKEAIGFQTLAPERPHILAMMESCLARQEWPTVLKLLWGMRYFWQFQGYMTDFRIAISYGLTAADGADDLGQSAECIKALGDVHLRVAEYDLARQRYEEARPIYAQIGARLGEANCIKALGDVHRMVAEYDLARQRYEEARPIYAQIGARLGEANCIKALGDVHYMQAEYDLARQRYEEARPIYAQIGARLGEANCIRGLGMLAIKQQAWPEAEQYLEAGLEIYQAIGSAYNIAWSYFFMGQVSAGQGDGAMAQAHYRRALALAERMGLAREIGIFRQALGDAERPVVRADAERLHEDIFAQLGLQGLSDAEKAVLLPKLEEKMVHLIVSQLNDEQCEWLNQQMEAGMSQIEVLAYLQKTIPDIQSQIRQLVKEFRENMA